MAQFSFQAGERLPDALRRIVREKIEQADHQLGDREQTLHERVHQGRKRFKEIRASLRLGCEILGRRQFFSENRWFRNLGRQLAAVRDARSALEAFEKSDEVFAGKAGSRAEAQLQRLLERREKDAATAPEVGAIVDDVRARLAIARRRVARWHLSGTDFSALSSGFETGYRRARNAFRALDGDHSEESVHNWRKRVKDLWYHMQIFREAWRGEMQDRTRALEKLSEILGDHHDLAVVRQVVMENSEVFRSTATARRLVDAIRDRQRAFEEEAISRGESLFAEKPARLTATALADWTFWEEEWAVEREARRLAATA